MTENRGLKFDQNKPKVSLIPEEAILGMAKAFTYGAEKYQAHNFRKGILYSRLLDATYRHLLAFSTGEDVDTESLNEHIDHAMASLAMLKFMTKNVPEMDDRFKRNSDG